MASIFCVIILVGCSNSIEDPDIKMEPGIKAELFISDPLVVDPVAYTFDETGVLYVVENRGYPDPAEGGTPERKEGRIAYITDANGDGIYDRRSEFVEGLTYPNGIVCWRGGVFVTCAPDIFYFKDTTGDGIADVREVALTGFLDTKTAQIRTSHPTLGLDGWIYVTSGLNGGEVVSPAHPQRDPVTFAASDGRFHPDTYVFETVGGQSQFGLTFDAWGNRFGVSNRNPIMQVVIEPQYLNRNTWMAASKSVKNVSKVGAEATVFPLGRIITTSDYIPNLIGRSHQGTFTAASSTFIYYGRGLSEQHQGNAFICESAQNLMQRQILQKEGPSYQASLPYRDREFMASGNEWFRPVYVNNGPDDALYVVDMRRKVIDHPSYVPEEVRHLLDIDSGKDLGRIYRISSKNYEGALNSKRWFYNPDNVDDLISRLDSDLEWDRAVAFRLLLEKEEFDRKEALEELYHKTTNASTRVRILWLLENKGMPGVDVLSKAFRDREAGVRLQAVKLASARTLVPVPLKEEIYRLARDPDMQVRLHSALALGSLEDTVAVHFLAEIAIRDAHDYWIREAILSGVGNRMMGFYRALVAHPEFGGGDYPDLLEELSEIFGRGAPLADCRAMAVSILNIPQVSSATRFATWVGLIHGLQSRREIWQKTSPLELLTLDLRPDLWQDFLYELRVHAAPDNSTIKDRSLALQLLGFHGSDSAFVLLRAALAPNEPLDIQRVATASLVDQSGSEGASILLEPGVWERFTPEIRSKVITEMISRDVTVTLLLKAVKGGIVKASEVSSVDRKRLMQSGTDLNCSLANDVFLSLEAGDRMEVFEKYRSGLHQTGSDHNGETVFVRVCSTCHSYGGKGGRVGPDLTGVNNQPAATLLLHILVPNYEVYPSYQTLALETMDGRNLSGWAVSESTNAITIRTASGSDEEILRSTIKSLQNTGQSLMPDGLEELMSGAEMNDLIAFLKKGSNYAN